VKYSSFACGHPILPTKIVVSPLNGLAHTFLHNSVKTRFHLVIKNYPEGREEKRKEAESLHWWGKHTGTLRAGIRGEKECTWEGGEVTLALVGVGEGTTPCSLV